MREGFVHIQGKTYANRRNISMVRAASRQAYANKEWFNLVIFFAGEEKGSDFSFDTEQERDECLARIIGGA